MSVARLVDTITGMLLQLPAPQRLEVLRQVEARVKPTASKGEIVRRLTRVGRGAALIALPIGMEDLAGTYKAQIANGKLILIPSNEADAKIKNYSGRLRLLLPKRLVEALGYPEFVRVRVENGRIIVEPA